MNIFERIKFWFLNSRPFSLPMTILPWLCVFIYSLKEGGNILNGIVALIGVLFAHMATNLVDDYIDYKSLNFTEINYKTKFKYLSDGSSNILELRNVIILYCLIAMFAGFYLFLNCGFMVVILSVIGGIIVLSYPHLSSAGFGELAVAVAFGPLLFEGVHYVMTENLSLPVLILSFAIVSFVTILLFVNNLLDFDKDIDNNKTTLAVRLGKDSSIKFFYALGIEGYFWIVIFGIITKNFFVLAAFLTIPLLISLGESLKNYFIDKTLKPAVNWWNFPLENWDMLLKEGTAPFYFNLLTARNLAIWVSLIISLALLIS